MNSTLRRRLLLVIAPALVLLLVSGGVGAWLIVLLGQRSSAILRENYDSVRAMTRLLHALDQINEAHHRADRGVTDDIRTLHQQAWVEFNQQLVIEKNNITILPKEQQLVDLLNSAADRYHQASIKFLANPQQPLHATLLQQHAEVVSLAQQIHDLNETQMQLASQAAQTTARQAILGFSIGFLVVLLSVLLALWWMDRTVVVPLKAMRDAARSIGQGELQSVVPTLSHDEIGELASEFNAMTRKLRGYKQSDLESLRRAQQTRQATIDSFPDPVIVLDPQGGLESANPAAQQLFGITSPSPGVTGPRWLPPEQLQTMVENARTERHNIESTSFREVLTFRFSNEERAYLPQIRRIESPEHEYLGTAVVLNDVTRFRLLDKFKTDWVATVSHELKTPLTSVRLAVHVLLEEVIGSLNPKQLELLLEARDSTERLFKLIEQLLALARLEDTAGLLQREQVDVHALLHTCADEVQSRLADKQIEFLMEIAPHLPSASLDPVRLKRAVSNLLDNAIQYTPSGGRITLRADLTSDNQIKIKLSDTGVGIPAEYVPHVFDRFFRVPGQEQTPGTGLGLAIVKEIVEAHDGQITCESLPAQGTSFTITLPFREGKA
ncbi:MAG: ATP-binding protein [Gemmatales bacterium]